MVRPLAIGHWLFYKSIVLTALLEYLNLLTHVSESGLAPECYVQISLEPGIFHHFQCCTI